MTVTTVSEPTPPPAFQVRSIIAPLGAIVMGTFMAILDTTVINVALPTLGHVFQTDLGVLQWVITGYLLAQAAVVPLSGWFSDRFGAKRVYLTAISLFTVGSILCAAAPSGQGLVVFRILQGLGGGMLMPVGMAFVWRLAPLEMRGRVMGMFGVPMLLAPALGPVISGWLLEFADWRLIFLINLPVGIAALAVGSRVLPALPAPRVAGPLDVPGVILGPLAFSSLSFGISQSATGGWTGTATLVGVGLGLAALVAFIARELSTEHPLLELRVFASRDFTLGMMTQWAAVAGLFGTMFLSPLFLQQAWAYGPFETGLYMLPGAVSAAIFMPVGGRVFDRFGARASALPGLVVIIAAQWLLGRITAGDVQIDLRVALAMQGAGMGLVMMPVSTHILNSAPRHLVTRVTSLSSAFHSVIAGLGIATWATLLQARMAAHLSDVGPGLTPGPEGVSHALALSFGDVYLASAGVAAGALLLAASLRRRAVPPAQEAGRLAA